MNRLLICALTSLVILFSDSGNAQYVADFSFQYGTSDVNIGSSLTITDLDSNPLLTITGRSGVDSSAPNDPDASANFSPAQIIWDGDLDIYTSGLGIQPGIGTGATGINGDGLYEDEEITFSYANGGVTLDSLSLTINGLDEVFDDVVIWLATTTDRFLIEETTIFGAATPNGVSGTAANSQKIDFEDFAGIVGGAKEVVTSFTLRVPTGEIWIKETEFGFAVPEPSSTALISLWSVTLLLQRRRAH